LSVDLSSTGVFAVRSDGMSENFETIGTIKVRVHAMQNERQSLSTNELAFASPSEFWRERLGFIDYISKLPDECFKDLRFHTYPLSGDRWPMYYGDYPDVSNLVWRNYTQNIEGIPEEYMIDEPIGGIGFKYPNGHFISTDIVRFQRYIRGLYLGGVFDDMKKKDGRKYVLEIGAGYGGLAHHVSELIGNVCYVIIDLPELLLLSGGYLTLNNPNKNVHVYSPGDTSMYKTAEVFDNNDFILFPNHRLDWLRNLRFDLVINTVSLTEMLPDHVNTYLDFICETCEGVFHSNNMDQYPVFNEGIKNLTETLRAKFQLMELEPPKPPAATIRRRLYQSVFRSIAVQIGLIEKPAPNPTAFREYIGTPLRLYEPDYNPIRA